MTSKPACVAISDIHFSLETLSVARRALELALANAEALGVPLWIGGDLHDGKDRLSAKVMNAIIEILKRATVPVYILVGNHDKVHEKAKEHGLNYLRPYAKIIDATCAIEFMPNCAAIPYQSTSEQFLEELAMVQPGWTVFVHQGVLGAEMGDYIIDKSSVDPALLANHNLISGHYHRHQTIGTLTYIGSPYTQTATEATDGAKGCLIVNTDGSWERLIFDTLRKHVVIETTLALLDEADLAGADPFPHPNPGDVIWLKLRGPYAALATLDKKQIGARLFGHADFQYDPIYEEDDVQDKTVDARTDTEVMDNIIDALGETDVYKTELKALWREVCSETR